MFAINKTFLTAYKLKNRSDPDSNGAAIAMSIEEATNFNDVVVVEAETRVDPNIVNDENVAVCQINLDFTTRSFRKTLAE